MLLSPPKDLNETLILGQELLNAVYKPLGTIPRSSPTDPLETTPYSTLRVLQVETHGGRLGLRVSVETDETSTKMKLRRRSTATNCNACA